MPFVMLSMLSVMLSARFIAISKAICDTTPVRHITFVVYDNIQSQFGML
jgi:hypothetical protein